MKKPSKKSSVPSRGRNSAPVSKPNPEFARAHALRVEAVDIIKSGLAMVVKSGGWLPITEGLLSRVEAPLDQFEYQQEHAYCAAQQEVMAYTEARAVQESQSHVSDGLCDIGEAMFWAFMSLNIDALTERRVKIVTGMLSEAQSFFREGAVSWENWMESSGGTWDQGHAVALVTKSKKGKRR